MLVYSIWEINIHTCPRKTILTVGNIFQIKFKFNLNKNTWHEEKRSKTRDFQLELIVDLSIILNKFETVESNHVFVYSPKSRKSNTKNCLQYIDVPTLFFSSETTVTVENTLVKSKNINIKFVQFWTC